jgi:hypothetical protein
VPEHEVVPEPDTAYSAGGRNTGQPATLTNMFHYPVTAVCSGCGEVIRFEQYMSIGTRGDWVHTGRRPGDTL